MKNLVFSWSLIVSVISFSQAQTVGNVTGTDDRTVITTAVPFLTITPDSRAAGMGDAGVATSPDANSGYWNPAKFAFIDKGYGFTTSYTPWLARLVNDMKLLYLSGFYKIDRNQTMAASLKYFDMGAIQFRDGNNIEQGRYNPREYAFDVSYSRRLTEVFSAGTSLRYIRSNLTGSNPTSAPDARPGNSVAVDLGVFYNKQLNSKNSTLSLAGTITNLGSKMTYTDAANKDFIPTNLRLGGAYKKMLDPANSLTFALDFNKLMVPSNQSDKGKPLLSGIFGSFSDAHGGWHEEFAEVTISYGMEYWYRDFFALRAGYFHEEKSKGNRKYLTAGVGFRYEMAKRDVFGLDVAYMIPTTIGQNALAETIRFTLFYLLPVKEGKQNETTGD